MGSLQEPWFLEVLQRLVEGVRKVPGAAEEETHGRRTRRGEFGTFADHRRYAPGDDLRWVDWNVYARTGELFSKVFQAEQHRSLWLALDLSASMAFGEPQRAGGARRLAAVLSALALARLDGLRLMLHPGSGAGGGGVRAEAFSAFAHLPRVLSLLESHEPRGPSDPLDVARAVLGRPGGRLLVWISDFLPPDRFHRALELLGRGRVSVKGLLPAVPQDERPEASGWVRLRDPESGEEDAFRADPALRGAVEEELRAQRSRIRSLFARSGHRLSLHALPAPGPGPATAWLPTL